MFTNIDSIIYQSIRLGIRNWNIYHTYNDYINQSKNDQILILNQKE